MRHRITWCLIWLQAVCIYGTIVVIGGLRTDNVSNIMDQDESSEARSDNLDKIFYSGSALFATACMQHAHMYMYRLHTVSVSSHVANWKAVLEVLWSAKVVT